MLDDSSLSIEKNAVNVLVLPFSVIVLKCAGSHSYNGRNPGNIGFRGIATIRASY